LSNRGGAVGDSNNHCLFSNKKRSRRGKLYSHTFTLLSSPEVTSTGWPGTHSIALMAPSCAPRTMCKSRPPALRSHNAMWPADDAEASIGSPSAKYQVGGNVMTKWSLGHTTSESKGPNAATLHEHAEKPFIGTNIVY
jgi:hypothetical protein